MNVPIEELVRPIIVQLMVIILLARVFAALFRKLGQPVVVGEILAGLFWAPRSWGVYFPECLRRFFIRRWRI